MSSELPAMHPVRRKGSERFRSGDESLDFSVSDFWSWSASDLVSNTARGALAEFIVAKAVGAISEGGVRGDWDPWDLTTEAGIKVEVKSSAYIQTWYQEEYSRPVFSIRKSLGWNAETNEFSDVPERPADVYVFALLAHRDQTTLDPLDLAQWEFFVVPRLVLDDRSRSQHSITLPSLSKLCDGPVGFEGLGAVVERAVAQPRPERVTP